MLGLALSILGARPVAAEPKTIGATEKGVRILRGTPGDTTATQNGASVAGPAERPAWAKLEAPADATPEARDLARSLVDAFGGRTALEAWTARGERTGIQVLRVPIRIEARFVERRDGERLRLDLVTSGYEVSMAVGPGGGWQRFVGHVTDLPEVQEEEADVAKSHDEALLLAASEGRAPARVWRDDGPRGRSGQGGQGSLLVWGPRGSATLFSPDSTGRDLRTVSFLDRSPMIGRDVLHTITVLDWRSLSPDSPLARGPEGMRVPYSTLHALDGETIEEAHLSTVNLFATFDDSVFARPGASESTVGKSVRSVLPLERHGGHHFVPVSIDGALPRLFLIDTGAGLTAISQELADTLGLPLGEELGVLGLGGGATARTTKLRSVTMGSLSRANVQCLVLDFSELRQGLGARIEGILGFSALNRYAVTFDFERGVLELAENAAAPDVSHGGTRVPFEIVGGLPQVEGRVDGGPPLRYIVDTGAWRTFVPRKVGEAIESERRVPGIPFVGADGRTLEGVAVRARSLSVGTVRVDRPIVLYPTTLPENDPVGVTIAAGERGVLGADFLRRFRVTLDYPRSELVLEPAGTKGVTRLDAEPETEGLCGPGLVAGRVSGVLRVQAIVSGSPAERARVRVGDRLVEVDDMAVGELEPAAVQRLLVGPRGSQVRVLVVGGAGDERRLDLERVDLL